MSPVAIFAVLLVLTFGIMAWVLKPTKLEADVQRLLISVGRKSDADADTLTILKSEALSSIPWLNELLARVPGSAHLRLFIVQAGSQWTVGFLLLCSLLAAAFAALFATLLTPYVSLALLAGIVVGFLPHGYLLVKRRARFRRFDDLLPDAIDLMARALRSGHSVTSAMEMVAQEIPDPLGPEFRVVFEEQNLGLPLREAIINLARRVALDGVRFLVTAILVQKETGGNLAEILDKTSALMRDRKRIKGQMRVYTAQGRITGWVLCTIPFIVFALISSVNPSYEKILWTDPLGIRLIYIGLVMMAIGIYIILKIIKVEV